jgi:hypothetical protein
MAGGKLTDDPRFWRGRAREARINADAERNPAIKHRLLSIAKNYEGLAERAEQRARAVRKPRVRR